MCGELIRGGREKQGAWKCNSKIREISKCTNILEVKLRELQTMQQLRQRESKQSNRIAVYDSLEEKMSTEKNTILRRRMMKPKEIAYVQLEMRQPHHNRKGREQK